MAATAGAAGADAERPPVADTDPRSVTVALDGFGAERGLPELLAGASAAAVDGIRVRLFGPGSALERTGDIEVIDTEEWITNDEDPVPAVRSRPRASVVLAAADVAAGNADAMVSAGSTGATMAASTFGIKRLRGVHRPALAALVPVPGKPVLFLDVGANTEVRPQHLVQFAFLGAAFSRAVLGVERPRVGLLSVGEEASKGTPDVVQAHRMLASVTAIDFVGNVEGRDLPAGLADVVVTDGFTGNVALKLLEGTAKMMGEAVRDAARANPLSALGGLMLRPALSGLRHELDPNTTGGAILLGLRKVAVVAHGSSSSEGIANAIRLAARTARAGAPERTAELLEAAGATRRRLVLDRGRA